MVDGLGEQDARTHEDTLDSGDKVLWSCRSRPTRGARPGAEEPSGMRFRQTIEAFYRGWETKDWNAVASALHEDLHFRSPIDDFRGLETYRSRCWPHADKVETIQIDRCMEDGDSAFIRYEMKGKDGTHLRGSELFEFAEGRIKSIDSFWYVNQ